MNENPVIQIYFLRLLTRIIFFGFLFLNFRTFIKTSDITFLFSFIPHFPIRYFDVRRMTELKGELIIEKGEYFYRPFTVLINRVLSCQHYSQFKSFIISNIT